MILNNFAGVELSGRYVIVQMDNGEGVHLNLREVRAFGPKGDTQKKTEHYLDWIYYRIRKGVGQPPEYNSWRHQFCG